jgi:sugar phosphate isomerase/epimerase
MTNRRDFLKSAAVAAAALPAMAQTAPGARKMTISLSPGSIGLKLDQRQAIEVAARHRFEAVEPQSGYLAKLSASELKELLAELKERKLVWGAAGLPVEFRRGEEDFANGMRELSRVAPALRAAGVTRVGTWLSPTHDSLTYLQNMRQHVKRLRQAADVLGDIGARLGLEYVGPKTSWSARRYPFVHSMAEMKDLIGEMNRPNVGILVDSWHWYTAGETVADLLSLKGHEVVCGDLNDAPAGIPVDQQVDSRRELPVATGVIDTAAFLNALQQIGFDGPLRAEPFNQKLNQMPPEEAAAATSKAMHAAFALIRS